eukprot:TRINITY_DN5736_c0_g1_i1.p1 TRINITY_DN5736_c0_g1~~TRINITY_DN5736_c0_g1_i1.p1  ORF type:complete len:600 (-),score=75.27 TRINITY_DN5736_c0_g1_i1:409-2175(-)
MSATTTIDSLPTVETSGSLPPLQCATPKTRKDTCQSRWLFRSTMTETKPTSTSGPLSEYVDDTDSDCPSLSSESDMEENSAKGVQIKQPEAAKPPGRRPMPGVPVDVQQAANRSDLFQKVRAVLERMREPSKEEQPSNHDSHSRPSFAIKIQDTSTVAAAKPCLPSNAFANVVKLAVDAKKTVSMACADDAFEEDTTEGAWSNAAQSRPSSATSTARGASEDVKAVRSPRRGKFKSQPTSGASFHAAEQPQRLTLEQDATDWSKSAQSRPSSATSTARGASEDAKAVRSPRRGKFKSQPTSGSSSGTAEQPQRLTLEQDTTDWSQSRPSSATSTARGASEDVKAVRSPRRGKFKSQPTSGSSSGIAEQPRCLTSLLFTPTRPRSPNTSTSATPAVVKPRHSRHSLLVPATGEHAVSQALTPTRPTLARRGSAPTNTFRERFGSRDDDRSPSRGDSRSPCGSRASSPCPVYSHKADAKGSGMDYNVVQFQATATVSYLRSDGKQPSSSVSWRKAEEAVEPEAKSSEKVAKEDVAKEEVLSMFAGCSRSEVKRALRGMFSDQDVGEVLTLLGLSETKHEKRRSRSKRGRA